MQVNEFIPAEIIVTFQEFTTFEDCMEYIRCCCIVYHDNADIKAFHLEIKYPTVYNFLPAMRKVSLFLPHLTDMEKFKYAIPQHINDENVNQLTFAIKGRPVYTELIINPHGVFVNVSPV